jgi:hypothetical protein
MSELSVGQLKGLTVNSNVMTVPSGHKLYAPGHVIQVVSVTKTNDYAIALSAGGFGTNVTGLEATITPTFSSSKIFVQVSTALARVEGRGIGGFRIVRNGTPVSIGDAAGSRGRVTSGVINDFANDQSLAPVSAGVLDSPNSTGALTYGIQLYGLGSSTFILNRPGVNNDNTTHMRTVSTITLMEIAA